MTTDKIIKNYLKNIANKTTITREIMNHIVEKNTEKEMITINIEINKYMMIKDHSMINNIAMI
jgi:hypothetical protein